MADDADHPRTTSKDPSLARVYDYFLGGSLNSPIDRHLAAALQAASPVLPRIARDQRTFLQASVEYLAGRGVRQFIDLGSGLPTAGHIHHIVQRCEPSCTVIYVDNDAFTVGQGSIILAGRPDVAMIQADIREPSSVVSHHDVRQLIDPTKPIGVTMVGVLEFIPDEYDPAGIVEAVRAMSDTDTYISLALVTDNLNADRSREFSHAAEVYDTVGARLTLRPPATLRHWLAGATLVGSGITPAALWSPAQQASTNREPDAELTLSAVVRYGATPSSVDR